MEAVIAESEKQGVYTLAVTTTPKAWERNHAIMKECKYVRPALGLHPQLVSERAGEFGLWENYLNETRYVGEVGLDAGPRFYQSLDLQKEVFTRVLKACAKAGDKILSVHSIRSASKVLDMLEDYLPSTQGQVVLHWFTGTKAEARRALELGCYFSVNQEMFKRAGGQEILKILPPDRVLTETDGPFTQSSGRAARPVDVGLAVSLLAREWGMDSENAANAIRENLRRLLDPSSGK